MVKRLIDEKEAAQSLGLRVSTLQRWRWAGEGPPYVKFGRAVRYDPEALREWIAANTVGGEVQDD